MLRQRRYPRPRKGSLIGYFNKADIDRVRIHDAADEGIAEPAYYGRLRAQGVHGLPAFSLMEAVTFDDVVVACGPMEDALLFHELIHGTQYRLLGVERLASRYVRGFLASGSYESIPLEACARHLAERHMKHSGPFDVEASVVEWMNAERF